MLPFRKTLEAFADTIVPPDDGPGGAAVGATRLYTDPFYRASMALPGVGLHLNAWALILHRRLFPSLGPVERTRVVQRCERSRLLAKAYEGLIMLTKLAFYGGNFSTAGYDYIGYPGPNEGYPDPGREKVVDSDTPDGNYP